MTARTCVPGVDLDVEALIRLRRLVRRTGDSRLIASSPTGSSARRQRGRGVETYDLRPWSEGDDIRRLDRNATARTGEPHVRNSHDERDRSALYLVDFRPSMLFGTRRAFRSVAAAEAAVASAWRTLDMQGRVGLAAITVTGTHFFGWAASGRAFTPLLDVLAAAHRSALDAPEGPEPLLQDALGMLEREAGSASVTVATGLDTLGEAFDAIVQRIARRRDMEFLLISDRFERAPPPGAYPYRTPDGDAGLLRISRRNGAPPGDYRPTRLRRLGARVLAIDANLDVAAMARTLESLDA